MPLKQQPFLMLPTRFLLFGLLVYIVIEMLGSSALQYMPSLQNNEQLVIVVMRLSELLGFMFFIHRYHVVESLGLMRPKLKELRVFTLIASICILLVAILYGIHAAWFVYIVTPSWLHGVSGLLLMVVLAPIVEELIFRGLLYRMLREQWGIGVSVVVSAVFFSLIHHGMFISPQLAGGIIFALAYEWSRSLWVSIALHMGANGAVYLLSVLGLAV